MPWESGELDWPWLLAHASVCGWCWPRVLGLCLTAPGWRFRSSTGGFGSGWPRALGMVLIPVVEPSIAAPVLWQSVASALFLELLAGAVLGDLAATIVAGARMAGELVAAQAGLSTTTLIDPETGDEIGPLGRLYGWIAVVAFLGLGGPLILVKVLAESYETVPAGGLLVSAETARLAFAQLGHALEPALRAAAPLRWRWRWPESSWDGSAARRRPFRLPHSRCRSAR